MANELLTLEALTPEIFVAGGVDPLLDRLERDVRAVHTDISTREGRAAISSLAFKVARSKTALDDLGKNLVAEWKAKSALVDAERRRVRERLDALRDEVRRPLTEWEEMEDRARRARVRLHETCLEFVQSLARFDTLEPSSEQVGLHITEMKKHRAELREWHEFAQRAQETYAQVGTSLQASLDAAVRRETERAELARLRQEANERARQERDDWLRAEAAKAERKRAEAEAAEAARVVAAKEAAERAKIDRERVAAEEKAREAQAAVEKAERERLETLRRTQWEKQQAEEKSRRDAEAAVGAERRRVAELKAAAQAEQERREADEKHREDIHGKIRMAFLQAGCTKANAVIAAHAVIIGEIPNTKVTY
jgi:colicin import membrane protein